MRVSACLWKDGGGLTLVVACGRVLGAGVNRAVNESSKARERTGDGQKQARARARRLHDRSQLVLGSRRGRGELVNFYFVFACTS